MERDQQGTTSPPEAARRDDVPSWEQLLDAMPQIVWVADGDGRVRFYNQRVHDYSGPLKGDDGSWAWRPLVHVDDAEATSLAWQHAIDDRAPYACEHRLRMADGSYRWHVSHATPSVAADGTVTWFGTATDIHDRALAEERARRSEERLARLIDGLFTFVGLCGRDGTLLEANATALHAGGLSREDVVGCALWDTYWWSHDAGAQAQVREAVARAADGIPSRFDAVVRVAGGRLITIDFQLVPLVEDGEVTALIPSGSDISARIADRARLEAMATLSHALNGASSTNDVTALICELGPPVVDADFINLGLLDEHHLALDITLPDVDEDIARRWPSVPLDGVRTPFNDVIATGEPVFVDPAGRAERYPDSAADAVRLGLTVSATMPLRAADGSVFGVMGCGWGDHIEVDAAVEARLRLLADLAAQALERSKRSDVHDRLVHELQARVLAGHEVAGGLDISVGYEPAQSAIGFGGDWYDVVGVDEHVTAVVVGDVAGHGIAAAAEMATTKATVRATILSAPSRGDVLPLASRSLGHIGSGFVATVAAAWIDTLAGTVEWRLAGHLPPVLRTPGSAARLLGGAHHPPLGMPTGPRRAAPEPFPPGSALVLCTDGLIERRGHDIDERLEALRAAVDAVPEHVGADALRDHLIAALLDDGAVDDVAIVVVVRPC